jgi:hypothetical protein
MGQFVRKEGVEIETIDESNNDNSDIYFADQIK